MSARSRAAGGVVVVGDAFVDEDVEGTVERLAPDGAFPVLEQARCTARPGGAGLAAAMLAADGVEVTLVTALGADAGGEELRALLEQAGVHRLVDAGLCGPTPRKRRLWADRPLLRLDIGCGPSPIERPGLVGAAVAGAGAILVADYGRGVAGCLTGTALEGRERPPVLVWDPHPKGPAPLRGATVVTPNRREAAAASGVSGHGLGADARRARALRQLWASRAVAITCGERGALLDDGEGPPQVIAVEPATGDTCGAGDRFAATLTARLGSGELLSDAFEQAVLRARDFVAAGGAHALRPSGTAAGGSGGTTDALGLARAVRRRGGTVVATGGCFDLLHAGHVRLLADARRLGDCLIVLLNGDASVRRLKGPGRPIVPQADRAAVLLGLGSVDAVMVFDEDEPTAALERLRPDLWVKGGDYAGVDLPELPVVERGGGQVVTLPYLRGRSTTSIIKEVVANGS